MELEVDEEVNEEVIENVRIPLQRHTSEQKKFFHLVTRE